MGRCWDECPAEQLMMLEGGIRVVNSCNSFCTHAYILTKHGAEILLDYNRPIRASADAIRVALHQEGVMKYHSLMPRVFDQATATQRDAIHMTNNNLPQCANWKYNGTCTKKYKWVNKIVRSELELEREETTNLVSVLGHAFPKKK